MPDQPWWTQLISVSLGGALSTNTAFLLERQKGKRDAEQRAKERLWKREDAEKQELELASEKEKQKFLRARREGDKFVHLLLSLHVAESADDFRKVLEQIGEFIEAHPHWLHIKSFRDFSLTCVLFGKLVPSNSQDPNSEAAAKQVMKSVKEESKKVNPWEGEDNILKWID